MIGTVNNKGAEMNERIKAVMDVVLGFVAAAALLVGLLVVWWLPVILQLS
jgi:hypothetical protein